MWSCDVTKVLCLTVISPDHSTIHPAYETSMQHEHASHMPVRNIHAQSCCACDKLQVQLRNHVMSCFTLENKKVNDTPVMSHIHIEINIAVSH